MAARDKIHDAVKQALIKEGWTITHDPFIMTYGTDTVFADLAAQKAFTAKRKNEQIIVEIKSFLGRSPIQDFKTALGQYILYHLAINKLAPEYKLYIALGEKTYVRNLQKDLIQLAVSEHQLPLIVVNLEKEEIVQWLH